jgi:hypothetical protein
VEADIWTLKECAGFDAGCENVVLQKASKNRFLYRTLTINVGTGATLQTLKIETKILPAGKASEFSHDQDPKLPPQFSRSVSRLW